jgi:catechol 2,3-dioxygenase-like lactoylglutathione lyase family enzyme
MKLDHINIHTDNLEGVKDALVRLLCLEVGYRPQFKNPGYWLYGEDYPIIHVTEMNSSPGETTGALNHVAFRDDDYDGLVSRLDQDEIECDSRVVPASGVRQIFFKINHDVMIEVDFDPVG